MKHTVFPTYEEAVYLHQALINRFGGQHGIRDKGLLESALVRPRSGYYESLSLQAAALLQSLILNHCFLDGNKRIAFALMAVFLEMNGQEISVAADIAEKFLIEEVIKNKVEVDQIARWIEEYLV